jgi:hypothetical protein
LTRISYTFPSRTITWTNPGLGECQYTPGLAAKPLTEQLYMGSRIKTCF